MAGIQRPRGEAGEVKSAASLEKIFRSGQSEKHRPGRYSVESLPGGSSEHSNVTPSSDCTSGECSQWVACPQTCLIMETLFRYLLA